MESNMQVMLFAVIIVLLLVVAGAFIMVVFSGRSSKKKVKEEDEGYVSVVRVRSAISGRTVMEILSDDLLIEGPTPYFPDLESAELKEESLIDRWRRTDLTPEERKNLAKEMRAVGYTVDYDGDESPSEAPSGDAPNELPENQYELLDIINSDSYSEEYKAAARRKLSSLLGAAVAESAPAGEESSDDEQEGDGEDGDSNLSGDGTEMEGAFEVDPVTGAPVSRTEPEEGSNAPEDIRDIDERDVPPVTGVPVPETDDDKDSRMAIELMRFIVKSLRKGLIDPELVSFAESRLRLKAVYDWTDEQKARALSRKDIYKPLEEKSVEEFDMFVRDTVAKRRDTAEIPVSKKNVTLGFNAHGGKNDLMWERLQNWAGELSAGK